jgi:hypothetical protein
MPERRQPEFDPDAAIRAVADELPDIETPVINIQDLARNPHPETRVNNSGVKVLPPLVSDEDQQVLDALAEFEREYAKLRRIDH